ncbi:MAG TPA: carboxypeptidase-like regulatory domain-containing protein [Prolixibacteraceae bacterium]|nr:carboxypeptidase-like regulatory domain-containing protein [Prolixibacteraceae bacterium]
MKNCTLVILLALIISTFPLFAQEAEEIDPMPITLKGRVVNMDDYSPVPYAYVINCRNHMGVTTNEDGFFTMAALNVDSLEISSLGFTKTIVHIPADYNELNVLTLFARPVRFGLPQVNVKGIQPRVNLEGVPMGKKIEIAPHLRGDVFNKKPSVLAAIFSPASFIQYYTSKSEREKRETRKAIITEKQWEYLSQYYNKDLVMELTGMYEYQADSFMIYFNSHGLLSQLSTEYEVRNAIKEMYKIYKAEGH